MNATGFARAVIGSMESDAYQRLSRAVDALGETALAVRDERDHLLDRARCVAEIIDLAKEALAKGESEAAMRHLLRAQLELS